MKHILITIVAVLLVGCGESQQASIPKSTKPTSIYYAAKSGDIRTVKQRLGDGTDVNAKDSSERTPLFIAVAIKVTRKSPNSRQLAGQFLEAQGERETTDCP